MNGKNDTQVCITLCLGSSCFARGNGDNLEIIETYLAQHNLQARVELVGSRCQGLCAEGPNMIVNGRPFRKVDRGMLMDILHEVWPEKENEHE